MQHTCLTVYIYIYTCMSICVFGSKIAHPLPEARLSSKGQRFEMGRHLWLPKSLGNPKKHGKRQFIGIQYEHYDISW